MKKIGTKSSVRKGVKAKPTRVHSPRNRKANKYKGVEYEDWFDQQVEELKDEHRTDDGETSTISEELRVGKVSKR